MQLSRQPTFWYIFIGSLTVNAFAMHGSAHPENTAKNHATPREKTVDYIPTKKGIWEQSLFRNGNPVMGPTQRQELCSGLFLYSPFVSVPSTEKIGSTVLQKVLSPDLVWQLPDGRYKVTGGLATTLGGDVTYTHLVTLHGNDSYNDDLILTLHANKVPTKHFYTGSGHWIAPCPSEHR